MMKLGSICIMMGALFALFSVITYGSDVSLVEGNTASCPRHLDLPGTCHNSRSCGEDLNAAFGASAMVQQCICQDLPNNKHRCTCCCACQAGKDEKTNFLPSDFNENGLQCNKI
ncbi:hypothetical protein P8452_58953 [Trifolium repens]|nr:hypothetical protein P8452_58953 [Trifolium repens]